MGIFVRHQIGLAPAVGDGVGLIRVDVHSPWISAISCSQNQIVHIKLNEWALLVVVHSYEEIESALFDIYIYL